VVKKFSLGVPVTQKKKKVLGQQWKVGVADAPWEGGWVREKKKSQASMHRRGRGDGIKKLGIKGPEGSRGGEKRKSN